MTDRDDVIVVERESEGSHSLGWFLLGAVLGAGAALLLAPQTGPETRRAIRNRALKVRDFADEKLQTLRETLGADDEEDEEEDEEGEDGADSAPRVPRGGRTGAAREELERRLARARARRRAARELDEGDDDEEPVA